MLFITFLLYCSVVCFSLNRSIVPKAWSLYATRHHTERKPSNPCSWQPEIERRCQYRKAASDKHFHAKACAFPLYFLVFPLLRSTKLVCVFLLVPRVTRAPWSLAATREAGQTLQSSGITEFSTSEAVPLGHNLCVRTHAHMRVRVWVGGWLDRWVVSAGRSRMC